MVNMSYWSDLPSELLDLVATHFDSSSDTRHFRSVCSEWRFAIPHPISTRFPPMKFFNTSDVQLEKQTFYHLSQTSNPSSPGWLIKTEENNPGSVRLFNLFSRSPIKHLPFNFPKQLDLTNIKIRELDHEYVLRNLSGNTELFNMEHEKVAIITSSSNNSNDFVILSTHDTGKLFMYQSVQQIWSILDDPTLGYDDRSIYVNDWSMHYVDVMEVNGIFYAVTNSGRTVAINVADYSTVKVTLLKNSIIGGDKKCLVKLSDDLLMVDFYSDTTPSGSIKILAVEIFKLNKEGQKWELLKSLGDHTLFISNHSSFSAIGLPGCKGNCIYFRFGSFDKNKCCLDIMKEGFCEEKDGYFEWKSEEIGVFDFEKGVVGILEEYLDNSQLFSWPPPSWVMASK
ncbi:F-box protein SKIP23-like [Silene latifolia]|uniref:F-box protein SKIP23-like n=1 Tax=Silene latifolia TaxID=37657 RepID=UPI003D774666